MELNLVLLSGINNEGKNVLFGFGLVKIADQRSIRWVLKRFIEYSWHEQRGKVYPHTVICPYEPNLNEAVDKTLSAKCHQVLFCQNSIKRQLRINFS